MRRVQYLLDEHVDRRLRQILQRMAPTLTVRCIGDPAAPPLSASDPDILIWCERHDFLLVTNNRRSMPGHLETHLARGHHAPGIFIMNVHHALITTANELILIWETCTVDEFEDRIWFLPISGRW
ncbi:MAG TPA: DUF5615 family PIN-like protein [Chloroflexi bacterium]|nr:DUF5615 family PIN-like protein [Chloroflexota bacterium]